MMSKAAKQPQVDQFRAQIKNVLELLELAGSPAGFLTLLPRLLNRVEKCPSSARIHRELVSVLDKEYQECVRGGKLRKFYALDWQKLAETKRKGTYRFPVSPLDSSSYLIWFTLINGGGENRTLVLSKRCIGDYMLSTLL